MLENVQFIEENGRARFAILPISAFEEIRTLLADEEKLGNYLDYLHIQNTKTKGSARMRLTEVKAILELD